MPSSAWLLAGFRTVLQYVHLHTNYLPPPFPYHSLPYFISPGCMAIATLPHLAFSMPHPRCTPSPPVSLLPVRLLHFPILPHLPVMPRLPRVCVCPPPPPAPRPSLPACRTGWRTTTVAGPPPHSRFAAALPPPTPVSLLTVTACDHALFSCRRWTRVVCFTDARLRTFGLVLCWHWLSAGRFKHRWFSGCWDSKRSHHPDDLV